MELKERGGERDKEKEKVHVCLSWISVATILGHKDSKALGSHTTSRLPVFVIQSFCG